jgi:hypothetical protein
MIDLWRDKCDDDPHPTDHGTQASISIVCARVRQDGTEREDLNLSRSATPHGTFFVRVIDSISKQGPGRNVSTH